VTASAIAIHDASPAAPTRQPPSSELVRRRPLAPEPLEDALSPPLDDDSPPSVVAPEDDVDVDEVAPEEVDEAPASDVGLVPPVTMIVRVVFATPSFAVPAPLADIAAT
jgi:hypothetical protein